MDAYQAVRSLAFAVFAPLLGIDMARFKKRKDEWSGYCAIHQSKTNNNCFHYNDATGVWHCFGCEAKGRGSIDLCKAVKSLGFKPAVEFLTPLVGQSPAPAQSPVLEAPIEPSGALQPLAKDSWRKFAVPCPWLEARVPDAAVRERYGVFCYNNPARRSAYSGRVMIPVKNCEGSLYGYLGRSTNTDTNEPKYLFPKNLPKSQFLFGAAELKSSPAPLPVKFVYLVESPFAVLKFASLGLPAVSPFGWSVSESQLQLLTELTKGVLYIPDRNKKQDAQQIAGFLATQIWLRFPPLPTGVDDPEFLTLEQIQALTK